LKELQSARWNHKNLTSYPYLAFHKGVITIKQVKKDVKWAFKKIKVIEIFMFYPLKPWQSSQVGLFSFIGIARNSNQTSI
jgi:hypothetical protein